MGRISDRIEGTIENWRIRFGEALKTFLVTILSFGIEVFMNVLGKAFSPKLTPLVDKLEATGKVPPELQPLLNEIRNPTGQVGAIISQSAGNALVGGSLNRIIDALFLPVAYAINQVTRNVIISEDQMLSLWLRREWTDAELDAGLSQLGVHPDAVTALKKLTKIRFTPDIVMRLWLRNKSLYETLWNDLKDTGVSPDRIEHLKELAYAMPTPSDVVNFMAHEALEEDMVTLYGLDSEFAGVGLEWFDKAGVKRDVAKLYWRDHWRHPELRVIQDLYHRGLITKEEFERWFRLVEVPPHWRKKMIELSWDLPNRIELRMMARYGLVAKDFLVTMLEKVGLHPDYRDVAADMMLAMGIRTDLSTRYRNAWINADQVKRELADSGLSPPIQERMYQWIVKNTQPERVVKERDLTVTDIIRGVKKGIISRLEGQRLIQDMGYDANEARFKLDINVPIEEEIKEVKQRELTKTDILKAYKQGDIDSPEAISRLMSIRYSTDDATFLVSLVDITAKPIKETKQRELTKIDIIKGVKAGVITPEEGYIMLQDIGYTPADSSFILAVRAEAIVGSPDTYQGFRNITQSYRASVGLPGKAIPLELIQAERDVKAAEAALANGKARKVTEKRLLELQETAESTKIAYYQLLQRFTEKE